MSQIETLAVLSPCPIREARRHTGGRGDFENRAAVEATAMVGVQCPTVVGCPVEVPIGGLHQPGVGACAVRTSALGAEVVHRRQCANRGDPEDREL